MTRTPNTPAPARANLRQLATTAGATAITGGPTAALGASHGVTGIIATALVSVATCAIASFGRDLLRLCTPPSLRSMRWAVKNGHMDGKFSPEQLIQLTQTLHQHEQLQPPTPADTLAQHTEAEPPTGQSED